MFFFNNIDNLSSVLPIDTNMLLPVDNVSSDSLFFLKDVVKLDDQVEKAIMARENNQEILKLKLLELKTKILRIKNLRKKAALKKRIKQLLELADSLDEDLLRFKISAESHNFVILGSYLKLGLYPLSEYDFDVIKFDIQNIVYFDYYYFFFIDCKSDYYFSKLIN